LRQVSLENSNSLRIEINGSQSCQSSPFQAEAETAAATKQIYESQPAHCIPPANVKVMQSLELLQGFLARLRRRRTGRGRSRTVESLPALQHRPTIG